MYLYDPCICKYPYSPTSIKVYHGVYMISVLAVNLWVQNYEEKDLFNGLKNIIILSYIFK